MKKIAFVLVICACALLFLFLRARSSHTVGSTDRFWSEHDVEGFKIAPETELREVAVTIYQQPQFYADVMPLKYTSYIEEIIPPEVSGGAPGGIMVLEKYPGFQNMFVYGDSMEDKLRGVPVGAITMSEGGEMLAQAKLVKKTSAGIKIKEQHLQGCREGTCSLMFEATSAIDQSGVKKSESNRLGQKSRDYYFLWPMGLR